MRSPYALACLLLLSATAAAAQVRVVAAGDIACDPNDPDFNAGAGSATRCHQRATSDLALALDPDAVLLLGDIQYEQGGLSAFERSFDPSWGRFGARLRPAPGNHEYATPGATGYFSYFGAAAAGGFYGFDLGDWRILSLDSNCPERRGCLPDSVQGRWLRHQLADHPGKCTLAYWHHPRFSSGLHGSDATLEPFWRLLYDAGADLVLSGHDHEYERFAPQDPAGALDVERGLREFVVGTGGKDLRAFTAIRANSQVREHRSFGVLWLQLRDGGYDWEFVTENGVVLDAGSAPCHGPEAEQALVLGRGRFRVEATWQVGGLEGTAHPGPEATPVAGVLWFFAPSNWELLVKVIDGCALNGHYWVFAAATTHAGFTLDVVDTSSGRGFRHQQAEGAPPAPLQATTALPCS